MFIKTWDIIMSAISTIQGNPETSYVSQANIIPDSFQEKISITEPLIASVNRTSPRALSERRIFPIHLGEITSQFSKKWQLSKLCFKSGTYTVFSSLLLEVFFLYLLAIKEDKDSRIILIVTCSFLFAIIVCITGCSIRKFQKVRDWDIACR